MTVLILTYCEHPALAYGSLLVFETLRVGFPTAEVLVVDNGSHPDVRPRIEAAAIAAGCGFMQTERQHFLNFHRWALLEQTHMDSVVLLDPDVVFWDNVEDWQIDGVMAGRLIPNLRNHGVTSLARLHPSHLRIPSVSRLRKALGNYKVNGFDPIAQFSAPIDGKFYFWDTAAAMYQALSDECQPFTEDQLDAYDHLFYGSHLPVIQPALHDDNVTFNAHQAAAKGDIASLKGIWRQQEKYFQNCSNDKQLVGSEILGQMVDTCAVLGNAQGVTTGHQDAVHGLIDNISAQV